MVFFFWISAGEASSVYVSFDIHCLLLLTSLAIIFEVGRLHSFLPARGGYLVHVWLPKAHVEAPVAGSMVLAGILLKLGRYGLLLFCPHLGRSILYLYLRLRVWGSIFCSLVCIRQADLKGLIAYSSVVHIGVVTVGVVRGLEIGYSCALLMVIAHGICSPMLFALAYLVYSSSHRRVINNNKGRLATPILAFFLFLLP